MERRLGEGRQVTTSHPLARAELVFSRRATEGRSQIRLYENPVVPHLA